jgi:type VI secretion system protein ImpJ
MKANRILWGDGMFVRPQHFQQQALYADNAVAEARHAVQRHSWGVRRLEIDPVALGNGRIQASALDVVFPDGTIFTAPSHDPLPLSRDLNELPQVSGSKTTLYACLPNLSAYGGNTQKSAGEATPRPVRFRNALHPVSDLYTHALEASLTLLELNVSLMLEEENRDGYDSVPIARLVKNVTGQWQIDDKFIPPVVTISAVSVLPLIVRRLLDILLAKSETLSGVHRERSKSVLEYGVANVTSFWLLHTINRNFVRLSHLSRAEPLHPEELYLTLMEFCGELLTFSSTYTLSSVPQYYHDKLTETFAKLDEMIRELLETVISTRFAVIPLTSPKPSFLVGRLDSERLVENVDFYLSIQSEMSAAQVIEAVPTQFKVGSPDDVEKILYSALPGVSLKYTPQTPSAMPVRIGNHYFALEPLDAVYPRMLQARSICIYVPESLSSLKIELVAVFR